MAERLGLTIAIRSFYGERRDLADLPALLRGIDAVVVNGEGTIHHTGGQHLIDVLRAAQRLGRPTHLVNAVLQDCDAHQDVLQRLTSCTVRDLSSSAYLDRLGVPHVVVFDSILEANFLKRPSADLTGQVIVTDVHGSRTDVAAALQTVLARLGTAATYYPLNDEHRAANWRATVADWRQAKAVVTGRHHGVCLAVMAGVPFVALGSNTWKVEGLMAWLPGGLSVCAPEDDVVAACDRAAAQPDVFKTIQRWAASQRPLATFDAIRRAA